MKKHRGFLFGLGLGLGITALAATSSRLPILRGFLQDNLDGNQKSITNVVSYTATGVPGFIGDGSGLINLSTVWTNDDTFIYPMGLGTNGTFVLRTNDGSLFGGRAVTAWVGQQIDDAGTYYPVIALDYSSNHASGTWIGLIGLVTDPGNSVASLARFDGTANPDNGTEILNLRIGALGWLNNSYVDISSQNATNGDPNYGFVHAQAGSDGYLEWGFNAKPYIDIAGATKWILPITNLTAGQALISDGNNPQQISGGGPYVNLSGDTMTGPLTNAVIRSTSNPDQFRTIFANFDDSMKLQIDNDTEPGLHLTTGDFYADGGAFHGNGTLLVSLDASQLTLGTVPFGRIANATNEYAGPMLTESNGVARYWSFNGSALTNLSGTEIRSGTISAARLPDLSTIYEAHTATLTNKVYATNVSSGGQLAAAVMPALTGDITTSAGSVSTALKSTGTAGTYYKTTFDAQGRETSGSTSLVAGDIPDLSTTYEAHVATLTNKVYATNVVSGGQLPTAAIPATWTKTTLFGSSAPSAVALGTNITGFALWHMGATTFVSTDQSSRRSMAPIGGYLTNLQFYSSVAWPATTNGTLTIYTNNSIGANGTSVATPLTCTLDPSGAYAMTNSGTASLILPTSEPASGYVWCVGILLKAASGTGSSALANQTYAWSVDWWHQTP